MPLPTRPQRYCHPASLTHLRKRDEKNSEWVYKAVKPLTHYDRSLSDDDASYLEAGSENDFRPKQHTIPDHIWGFETTTLLGLIALFIGVFFITLGK